jgi:hypothetical protein
MAQEGLGRLYNARITTTTAALTVSLAKAGGVSIFGTSTGAGDVTFTQRTAADAGGSSAALTITTYYTQTNGVWTKVTQTADDAFAMNVTLWCVEVRAEQLSDGYKFVTASAAAGTMFLLTHDLRTGRAPANLPDIRA